MCLCIPCKRQSTYFRFGQLTSILFASIDAKIAPIPPTLSAVWGIHAEIIANGKRALGKSVGNLCALHVQLFVVSMNVSVYSVQAIERATTCILRRNPNAVSLSLSRKYLTKLTEIERNRQIKMHDDRHHQRHHDHLNDLLVRIYRPQIGRQRCREVMIQPNTSTMSTEHTLPKLMPANLWIWTENEHTKVSYWALALVVSPQSTA